MARSVRKKGPPPKPLEEHAEGRVPTDTEVQRRRVGFGEEKKQGWIEWALGPEEIVSECGRKGGAPETGAKKRLKKNKTTKFYRTESQSPKGSGSKQSSGRRSDVNSGLEKKYKEIPRISGKGLVDQRELASKQSSPKQKASKSKSSKTKSGKKTSKKKKSPKKLLSRKKKG